MQNDLQNLSEEDKKRKKHSIDMELVILDSDMKKMVSQKTALEAEVRKLKYDEERIRISLEEKKAELEKAKYGITQSETEIKRLKKQLNLIT